MKYLKKYKLGSAFVLIFIFSEILLRLFWTAPGEFRHNPLDSKFEALAVAIKQKPLFYQNRFCDSIHQTNLGEKDVSTCVLKDIGPLVKTVSKDQVSILAAGASTTHGYSCNSETSWPNELALHDPKFKVLNIADDGGFSDESILKIEKQLQQNKIPDILIWGHGFTEFLFYGDERDINWEVLKNDTKTIEALQKDRAYKENTLLKVLQFDITIQKYILSYRFLRVKMNLAMMRIKDGYVHYLNSIMIDDGNSTNSREKFVASSGFLGGPVRTLFSQATQEYALNNYRLNLQRLAELAKKHSFKVVCIKLPHVEGLLSYFSEEFSLNYDNWIKKVNTFTDENCKKLNFTIADVDQCYQNMATKPL